MTKSTWLRGTSVMFLALSLAACAGSGGGGAAGGIGPSGVGAAALDACKLLTNAEVEAQIGEAVAKAEGGSTPTGAAYCNWYGNDTKVLQKGISLIVALDNGKERYDAYKALLKDPMDVVGLGTEAVSTTDAEVVSTYEGSVQLTVSPLYTPTGIGLTETFALATIALKRAEALAK